MFKNSFAVSLLMLVVSGGLPLYGQDCLFKTADDESLKQSLQAFHEVMRELVHGPAEKGDFGPVRAKAAELARQRDQVMAAGLPGKLSGRCAEISVQAKSLSLAVEKLAADAAASASDETMKVSLNAVHSAYRNLNNALLTLEDLVDAFHDVIHPLWHDAYPKQDAGTIKTAIPRLKVRAKLLLATAEKVEPAKVSSAQTLLDRVSTLEEAGAAGDDEAVLEALRIVHDAFHELHEEH